MSKPGASRPAGRVIDLAIGVVRSPDGRVLVAQRRPGTVGAGYWEFPGGKIDPGENPAQAAARELWEEVGLQAHQLTPWHTYEHQFTSRRVRLHWFTVDSWSGTAHGREGQPIAWVDPGQTAVDPVLPSHARVLTALGLPDLVGVARVAHGSAGSLTARLPGLAAAGLRLLVVKASDMTPAQRIQLTRRLQRTVEGTGLRLVLAGTGLEARQSGAWGQYTSAGSLRAHTERPATPLWAVSVHGTADLQRATQLGADLALASPVKPTASHPGHPGIGWDGLRALVASTSMPVYAQGGLDLGDRQAALSVGACGIAVDVDRVNAADRTALGA